MEPHTTGETTVKRVVWPEEFWPVFVLSESEDDESDGLKLELSEEFVERFERIMEEFFGMQVEIEEIIENNSKGEDGE